MSQWVGTVLDGKYELKALLGEGGMGAVYEAQHKLIGRRLAVKFLHPQYATNDEVVTRFQREAQAAAQIGHENIIEVTDMGTASDGSPYIVMEFLEGCDVKKVIEDVGILDIKRASHIMVQALSALQAAHDVGIIHRDLKPENIFLIEKPGKPDYVKLLDFGISKFKDLETDGAKALTQTGTVLGTPHYMSPEQARGEQDLTVRSDVYAMGVILYQMLTGHLPFDAPNYNALLIKILTEDPPLPETLNPELPEDLAETIKIAMARDPNERFQDCTEFRSHLLPFAPGSTGTGINLSTASKTAIRKALYDTKTPFEMSQSGIAHKKSKLPLILGAAAAAVLAVVVGVVFVLSGGEEGDSSEASPPVAAATVATPESIPTKEVDSSVESEQVASTDPAESDSEKVEKEEEADTDPQVEEVDNEVKLSISASPADATIAIDGATITNPYTGEFIKSAASRTIVITAPGYKKMSEMVSFDKDLELVYTLEKEPEDEKSRRSKKRRKSSSGSSDSSKKPSKKPRRVIDYEDPWG